MIYPDVREGITKFSSAMRSNLIKGTMQQRVQDMMRLMSSKVRSIADTLSDDEIHRFLDEILRAKRIYVMGAGRSGLVAKAFAMRLMHLGLSSFVVGETITPAMSPGDVMIIFSGSGRTKTVADIAETAKEIGARICLITSNADSRIGKIADVIVIIEHQRDEVADDAAEFEIRQMMGEHKSFAPLGTIFETAAMVFADAIISRLMEINEIDERDLRSHHANVE
jgi:6-phospho-3-hexuloisomerase